MKKTLVLLSLLLASTWVCGHRAESAETATTPLVPPAPAARSAGSGAPRSVDFDWFEYTGQDALVPLPAGSYRNPILGGFYPDPSICRVGADYYLVNSSFAYFPGVPIFHSRDLVHWKQIGHVLTRPSQLKLTGLGVSRGIFAPSLRYQAGTFYMITTLVDGGGNFYVTAKDPAGPWSDPVWLPEIDGIDPSFFFDDGRAYVINNGPPAEPPRYDGHRALWIQELDLGKGRLTGPREVVVNGGVDIASKPIWIEGPHLYKKDGWYLLMAAEGGTSEGHSEVVFRSRSVRGPYVPWERNPILTQRTLPVSRPDAVTSTGHADLVETPEGAWWAVFLGCRPYDDARRLYNTGRETFLLPVRWADGWPVILDPEKPVPLVVPAPAATPISAAAASAPGPTRAAGEDATPLSGNFTWRDEFTGPALDPAWNSLRAPAEPWASLRSGALQLEPQPAVLGGKGNPAFLGRRQQHQRFTVTAAVRVPTAVGQSGGIVAFQNETHHFYMGVRRQADGLEVFLERAAGQEAGGVAQVVARQPLAAVDTVLLRIEGRGRECGFSYAARGTAMPGAAATSGAAPSWRTLAANEDGSILSTAVAGGFVGTYLGLHARLEP